MIRDNFAKIPLFKKKLFTVFFFSAGKRGGVIMALLILILSKSIGLIFDLFINILAELAKKTDNTIDDKLVQILRENKTEICNFLLELLQNFHREAKSLQ